MIKLFQRLLEPEHHKNDLFVQLAAKMSDLFFSWIYKDVVACFARPTSLVHYEELKLNKIKTIISLTENVIQPPEAFTFEIVHLPIIDYTPPTIEQITEAIQVIDINTQESKVRLLITRTI